MSRWIDIKKKEIKKMGDEIYAYVSSDDNGSIYAVFNMEELKERIEELEDGCEKCGEPMNNADKGLCYQCEISKVENMKD